MSATDLSHADHLMCLKLARPWCYWVFPGWWSIDHGGRYIVSVVVDREAGHYPTGAAGQPLILTRAEAPELEAACLEARYLNRDRGIADRESDRIVASSLGATAGRGDRFL